MRGRLAVVSLATVLYAGFFKGSPLFAHFPVDLTVAGVALTLLAIGSVGLISPSRLRAGLPVLGLAVVFLLGVGRYAADSYATIKVERLYGITLVAAFGVAVLLRTESRQKAWVRVQIGIGVLLSIGAVFSPAPTFISGDNALALEGSTTISAGRAAGVAVVGCLVLALIGTRHRFALGVIGLSCTYPLLSSGSRGPVAAAVLAVLLVALLAPAVALRRVTRLTLTAVSILIGYYAIRSDTVGGIGRVTSTLFAGNFSDTSSAARATLWRDAAGYIARHPFGSGWGGLSTRHGNFQLLGLDGLNYPHNVLLEITAEAGWIAGAAAIAFLGIGLSRLRRASTEPYRAVLFGMAMFFVLNALVSGDVNDNRLMWAAVAVAFAIPRARSRQPVVSSSVAPREVAMARPQLIGIRGGDVAWDAALGVDIVERPVELIVEDELEDEDTYTVGPWVARWDAVTSRPLVRIVAGSLFFGAFVLAAMFPPHLHELHP